MSLDNLYEIADKLNIKIIFKPLPPRLLGKANAITRMIYLDISLKHDQINLKCILAEEIGHILYPPRNGHTAFHSKQFYQLENRGNIEAIVAQDERKALDWATGILITNVEFWRILNDGLVTMQELVDYFAVKDWFMQLKIEYLQRKKLFNVALCRNRYG